MVDTPRGQGNGMAETGPARGQSRSSLSAEERSALARNIFAQLKEPPRDHGAAASAGAPAGARMPVAVAPTSVGGIRVVGPAAQAAQAQAAKAAQAQAAQATQLPAGKGGTPAQPRVASGAGKAPAVTAPSARPVAAVAKPPRARMRFRLLPVTIFLLVLMLGMRVGDSWRVLTRGGALPDVSSVVAQTPPPPGKDTGKEPGKEGGKDAPKDAPKDAAKDAKDADRAAKEAETAAMLLGREPRPDTIDLELVKHLTERREELERRSRAMDQREALIAAGEKRLDQKMGELQGVRTEIQNLLKQVDDKQRAQIESLVRIYETMKPKDAARIFEALEMPVLMEVVERMKEAKTAPVLAAMDPIKARDLTTALAERRRVPSMPQ